ncbi:hypothetical protein J3R83DRAFT_5224 [Lanmaoa asiatica]|nr:hypothetical protein J3R83DRAFT_5224 [Lanmaoa asiatica]
MPDFHQISAQVVHAKAVFNQKPIYTLLSIDVWFVLLYFPGDPPSLRWSTDKYSQPRLDSVAYRKLYSHIVIPPAPIVNEDRTAFSPEFLYALQLSVEDLTDVTVTLHPFFRPPNGTAERISRQLEKQLFSARIEEEGQRAEIENKFALGEEDSDEWSTRHSMSEEPETDLENQNHPAAAPVTLDHLLTSPAKTRSNAIALKSHAAAEAPALPGTSKVSISVSDIEASLQM